MASDKVVDVGTTEEKRKKEKSRKRKHDEVEDTKEKKVKDKSKKRKQEDTESASKKKSKKERSKKRKQEFLETESQDVETGNREDNSAPSTNAQVSKPQKRKTKEAVSPDEDVAMESKVESPKAEKKKKKTKTRQQAGEPSEAVADVSEGSEGQGKAGKGGRFIVFVGNLPYSATKEALTKHFKKIEPVSIRLLTDRESGKCKGAAFVELENWDRMNTALKLYHHTMFEDGVSKARKINVELSAGGGGKGENRKEKIKQKNDKLYEERRQMQEKKQQESKTDSAGGGKSAQADNHVGMHPSRRALMGV